MALCLLSSLYGLAEGRRLHLFHQDMKEKSLTMVYDFVERYFYEIDSLANAGHDIMRRMKDDKVIFIDGSLSTVYKIGPYNPYSISRIEDKAYSITWTDSTQTEKLLTIMFPASFELIYGQPRYKLERTIKAQLSEQPTTFEAEALSDGLEFEPTDDGCLKRVPVKISDIESVSDAVYCMKNANTSDPVPVFDDKHRWYSASNLFQGIVSGCDDYRLHVLQSVFEFETLEYTVSLSQWLNYCRSLDAVVYIGLQEEREDGLILLLLAQSQSLGFEHMLSVVVPWNFVGKKDAVLKARLHAYIPKNNVKTMYQENYSKTKKKKIRI